MSGYGSSVLMGVVLSDSRMAATSRSSSIMLLRQSIVSASRENIERPEVASDHLPVNRHSIRTPDRRAKLTPLKWHGGGCPGSQQGALASPGNFLKTVRDIRIAVAELRCTYGDTCVSPQSLGLPSSLR